MLTPGDRPAAHTTAQTGAAAGAANDTAGSETASAEGNETVLCGWPCSLARPTLSRSVASLAVNAAAHNERARFLICVDRDGADADVREALASVSRGFPATPPRVVGMDARRRFLDLLPARIDRDVVSSALVPDEASRGPGYNRNFLLLAAAGGFLVMTDDDVICEPAASRGTRRKPAPPAPTFTADPFPVPLRFFPDRNALRASVDPIDIDVIGRHRALLGSAVDANGGHADAANRLGTIALACAGCYGDSGLGRARTVLSLAGVDRDESFARGYERIRRSRELVRVTDEDLAGTSMVFMAGHCGYDAREILPPFFPFTGNEDGFFATLVRACRPGSLTAYPAFALLHDPPSARAFASGSVTDVAPTVTDLMMSSLVPCLTGVTASDPRERMSSIGQGYIELASLASVEFAEAVHDAWSRGAQAYAASLESLLDRYDRKPDLWASDVDETLERIRELLREPALLFGTAGSARSIDSLRDRMSAFGRLLELWPDVFDFARANRYFFEEL